MTPQKRDHWIRNNIPPAVIERMAAFEDRWGGLHLPPALRYEGGPKFFRTDLPEPTPYGGWCFEAGDQRTSVPYGFLIGANDEFGIHGDTWTPLHASMEGWIESVALEYTARRWAPNIRTIKGTAVDDIDFTGMDPVPEVEGLADNWWRGQDAMIAIYRGEAHAFGFAATQHATIYADIPELPIYLDF
jgi:hypothetical protein